jgi:hypothetical protein
MIPSTLLTAASNQLFLSHPFISGLCLQTWHSPRDRPLHSVSIMNCYGESFHAAFWESFESLDFCLVSFFWLKKYLHMRYFSTYINWTLSVAYNFNILKTSVI